MNESQSLKRNIASLLIWKFLKKGRDYHLSIYGDSDIPLESTEIVTVHGRISQGELEKIEAVFQIVYLC